MHINHTIQINRPPEQVFAFITDPASGPKISKDIISITPIGDQPLGVGSTFHEVIKEGRKHTTYLGTVTEYQPNERYGFTLDGWGCGKAPVAGVEPKMRLNLSWHLVPEAGGTRLDSASGCDTSKAGFGMRLMFKLMTPMVRMVMKKQMAAAKAAIEAS
jgi:carbon monoxide dehydrogenase subunit G